LCFQGPLTKITLLEAQCINGLYHIPLRHQTTTLSHAFLDIRTSADMWHARLGHPSTSTTLQILHSKDLSCSSNMLTSCNDCLMTKARQLPFNPFSSTSSYPLEIIHSDVWGHFPITSLNGFRYYAIFVDYFSRFI
jgi:GAG-pre-integrase domain